jgi:hypothetical protein
MGYRNLVDAGADRTEIQSYLTQGGLVTTTIRIPANLKETVTQEATLQGLSFSAFMRLCAIQRLSDPEKAGV